MPPPRVDLYCKPGCQRSSTVCKAMSERGPEFNVIMVDDEDTKAQIYSVVRRVNPMASSVRMPVAVIGDDVYMDFDVDEFMREVWSPFSESYGRQSAVGGGGGGSVMHAGGGCSERRPRCCPRSPRGTKGSRTLEVFAKKGCQRCSDLIRSLTEANLQPHVYLTDYWGNRAALWRLVDEQCASLDSVDLPILVSDGTLYLYSDIPKLGLPLQLPRGFPCSQGASASRVSQTVFPASSSVCADSNCLQPRPNPCASYCNPPQPTPCPPPASCPTAGQQVTSSCHGCHDCLPKIQVYAKTGCGRCAQLQDALGQLGLGYELFDLKYEGNLEAMWDLLNAHDPQIEKVNLPVVVVNHIVFANFESVDGFITDILQPIAPKLPASDLMLFKEGVAIQQRGESQYFPLPADTCNTGHGRTQPLPKKTLAGVRVVPPAPPRVSIPVLDTYGKLQFVDLEVDDVARVLQQTNAVRSTTTLNIG
uniref:Glutaredoxin domain-containing protein n=1 Tax=Chromera velia CCMP2878 TaxID=1169474 RepID=A0A0G4I0I9_9ALVE|eukprot:Cvel_9926.t1-p1 / transcript=Cvel_9926.t1 / gene=Cvel_9926 / organism=Chromera_velia_CCMP2878 / gene_product=hypothetical protein / transcript_product=hypothetical protein / location=Cvel_scaffold586:52166-54952(+) / protein_length=475 / sequence_SO=supercontig / SO=protein_coding / is_pseudo=false